MRASQSTQLKDTFSNGQEKGFWDPLVGKRHPEVIHLAHRSPNSFDLHPFDIVFSGASKHSQSKNIYTFGNHKPVVLYLPMNLRNIPKGRKINGKNQNKLLSAEQSVYFCSIHLVW